MNIKEQRENLVEILDFFREHLPLKKKVKLFIRNRLQNNDSYGSCGDNPKSYSINIKANQPYISKIDVLIHEYAHAVTFEKYPHNLDSVTNKDGKIDCLKLSLKQHDYLWGIEYANVYRKYLEYLAKED